MGYQYTRESVHRRMRAFKPRAEFFEKYLPAAVPVNLPKCGLSIVGGEVEAEQRQTFLELPDIDAMVIASIDCLEHIKDAVEGYSVLEQAQQLPLDK